MKEKIILTFDLEFWYNSGFLKKYISGNMDFYGDYIKESVEPILNLMNKYGHKATFFVLGRVVEKYPELIKRINEEGHEIGSHGYSHNSLFELDEEKLKNEIELTNNIIKNITGKKPDGFRAPNFSLNEKTFWAVKILKKYFDYDSSIHPLSSFETKNSLKEVYCSLGGIYFRLLPLKIYLLLAKIISRQKPVVIYFHPYELFESSPKLKSGPWLKRKIKYWGTKTAWKKFNKLMEQFDFISIKNYLKQNENLIN